MFWHWSPSCTKTVSRKCYLGTYRSLTPWLVYESAKTQRFAYALPVIRATVVPTNVTIPLNVTAPDKYHNSPRQKSQPTTNVTTLPRQMSQPATNVTTLPRQMSQLTTNVASLPRQMSQPTTNVTTVSWLPTTNVTTSRQMSVVMHITWTGWATLSLAVEYYTWSETQNIFIS